MKDRVYFLDRLRVLACFMVCMIHVCSYNFYNVSIDGTNFMAMNIYDSIVRCSVPIFVMISGYIFLNRDINYKTLIQKHVLKMLIVFVVFLGLYYFLLPFIAGDRLNNSVSYKHLWFLIMMAMLYLITPILKKITEDINVERLFLLFMFIFKIALPNLEDFFTDLSLFTLSSYVSRILEFLGTVNIRNFFDYSLYYVLGHYLSKVDLNKTKRIIIYILGIVGLLITYYMTKIVTIHTQVIDVTYYQNFMINIFLVSIALFVLFKYNFNTKPNDDKLLLTLSKASFGVYLIHIFIIHLIAYFGLNTLSFSAFLSIPVITILVYLLSTILIILALKIVNK